MGCKYHFLKFLSLFDAYSSPFQIQFRYSNSFKSTFGGIVSFIFYIIILAAFIFLYVLLHQKEEQKTVSFDLRHDIPFRLTLEFNKENRHYTKEDIYSSYFLPAFYIIDKTNNIYLTENQIKTHFNINFSYKDRPSKELETSYTYTSCSSLYSDLSSYLKTSILSKAFCFQISSVTIEGEFLTMEQIPFRYLQLTVQPVNQDEINTIASQYQFVVLYTDYTINNELHDKSPIEFSIKPLTMDLLAQYELSYDVYLSCDEFYSQDNLYAHWAEKYKEKIARVNRISKRVQEYNDTLITVYFRSDFYYRKYIRTYKTFFEFIYQIGGLLKVFVFIGGLLAVGINLSLMNVSISNLMYNMIHPNNEKDVLLPYKECEKQEEDKGLIAPIFLSLNPILKQLSYEYYRFERSRGMEFDVKEALSKLFLCCCNVKTIKQKDKIFAESGREIEKVLDTRTVVTFAQQCRKMKYLILNNNAVMLGYMKQQNISYDTLYLIRQDLLHQQIMTSASPMSITYYKQNFFINALITMRNQGDLSRKDILIFKVMGLNKKLLQKFFISYSDRLSLIYPKNDKDNQDVINTQTGLI